MKKTVILSTNDNPDYLMYLPYVQKTWNQLGWDTLTFYLGNYPPESSDQNRIVVIDPIPGIRDVTVVQCVRLLAHLFVDEGMIMTSDVDMIPMSNYFDARHDCLTVYGRDLTGDNQIPMCYVAAPIEKWKKLFPEESLDELLEKYPQSRSLAFNEWWFTDQNILTERVDKFDENILSVHRGIDPQTQLPIGRIDRAAWDVTIERNREKFGKYIDAHMLRPFNKMQTERIMNLINTTITA